MNQYEQLINELADKTLSFGCSVRIMADDGYNNDDVVVRVNEDKYVNYDCYEFTYKDIEKGVDDWKIEILGHPVMIGDVLEKMTRSQADDLLEYWSVCGFTKSLGEIYEENYIREFRDSENAWYMKPEAKELFDFLLSLNLK